jgi:hypothetical protein
MLDKFFIFKLIPSHVNSKIRISPNHLANQQCGVWECNTAAREEDDHFSQVFRNLRRFANAQSEMERVVDVGVGDTFVLQQQRPDYSYLRPHLPDPSGLMVAFRFALR